MDQGVSFKQAFKVLAAGSFNVEGFQTVTSKLDARGTVKNLFFSEQSGNMKAAATFFVQTDGSEAEIKADLLSVPGVELVLVEHNDDTNES